MSILITCTKCGAYKANVCDDCTNPHCELGNNHAPKRHGFDIFSAICSGKEWDFTDAEFESAVLDRQNCYSPMPGYPDMAALPRSGSDFSGEIRNMLSALANHLRKSAAPEELPRIPTMDMKEAGRAVHQAQEAEYMTGKVRMRFDLVTEIWQAMYDAAKGRHDMNVGGNK
jgi:hypothetical protein